jgi:hypothetical protein
VNGKLEQIPFLLGHICLLITEQYLGCKQNMEGPLNERIGLFVTVETEKRTAVPIAIGSNAPLQQQ